MRSDSRALLFAQTRLAAPWGIRAEGEDHFPFHVISRGRAWLDVDGLPPVEVAAGDVVLLAPGHGHSLRDALDTPAESLQDLLRAGAFRPAVDNPTSASDGRSATDLVCGCFRFHDQRNRSLLSDLPTVMHGSELVGEEGPWLAQTIKLLARESLGERPGKATVVNRLCDALFVYILRSHLSAPSASSTSWLRALVDPQVGEALRLIHESPSGPWTVSSLAARVAMSRSGFAARFKLLTGEPPMQYLTRWRLQQAATMLEAEGTSIAQVAARSGYDSEAAFNKAFKRSIGITPGQHRREARSS